MIRSIFNTETGLWTDIENAFGLFAGGGGGDGGDGGGGSGGDGGDAASDGSAGAGANGDGSSGAASGTGTGGDSTASSDSANAAGVAGSPSGAGPGAGDGPAGGAGAEGDSDGNGVAGDEGPGNSGDPGETSDGLGDPGGGDPVFYSPYTGTPVAAGTPGAVKAADLPAGVAAVPGPVGPLYSLIDATEPDFLKLPAGMTDLQKRSYIFGNALFGNDSRFRDPAALNYAKTLLMNGLVGPDRNSTVAFDDLSVLPVERSFISQYMNLDKVPQDTSLLYSALQSNPIRRLQ